MTLPTQLQQYRHAARMNQAQLAEQLHVSRQTISNWETGKSLPDIDSLIAMSDLLAVSLDALIRSDPAVQQNLRPTTQLTPTFIAGACFVSFLTVLNSRLMDSPIDLRLRVTLLIGQLLFGLYLLQAGKAFARSPITRRPHETVLTGERFAAFLMFWATAISTGLTLVTGILTLTN